MSIMDKEIEDSFEEMLRVIPHKYFYKIHTIYNLKVSKEWRIENRKNQDLHLIFVKEGHGYYDVEGEEIELKPGRLIFVSHDCLHSAYADTHHLPSIIPIRFGIYNFSQEYIQMLRKPFYYTTIVYNYTEFKDRFEKLYDYHNRVDMIGKEHLCHGLFYQIFSDLLMRSKNNYYSRDKMIKNVKEYIDKKGNHKLKMEQLAALYGTSSKNVYRLFKDYYGITPKQYLIQSLLEKADYYIENTSLTLTEIAVKLGYPDVYTFSKQYKRSRLIPPSLKRGC
ncbi:helix-turn-helix transcriptional regulator [Vallitalea okinawensis]|uniref:helix-turn-helix transcriptional regulator n=1 Tax=Vallitalea okinawensis TaxID=2078660 RepID=UPI000CFDAB2A|nr:AraC family transcriptional regulator [Vallitalea okinawensis]